MTARVSPHPDEDRLLELAYGEVPPAEARTLRQHVDGCTRCRDVLQGIAEVRSAVRSVPPEPAPERGLESLLAYGEQAAARARSHRRSLRLVGLLSVATAVALAWVLLPLSPRERPGDRDMLVRADAPTQLQAPAPTASAPEEKGKTEQRREEASGAIVAMASKADERQKDAAKVAAREQEASSTPSSPPAAVAMSKRAAPKPERHSTTAPSPPAVSPAPAGSSSQERAREPAAGGLMEFGEGRGQADRSGPATAPSAGMGSGAQAVGNGQKARSASEATVDKKQRMNGAEIAAAAAPAALGKELAPPSSAADAAVAPKAPQSADALISSPARRDFSSRATAAPEAVAQGATIDTGTSATGKASSAVQPLRPADRPAKAARLEQVRREVGQASGDRRKALLFEQCRLEAELQMGPAAVQTCSQVAREFPGTQEAKQATELASGFSVQLPPR
jgi:hypothetical protein